MKEPELRVLLRKYNIPFDTWGTGEAKTFGHLVSELRDKESRLSEQDGTLIRYVRSVTVIVRYDDDSRTLRLKEDRQVFKDGRVRRRTANEGNPVEKIYPGESPVKGAHRLLREELGIAEQLPLIPRAAVSRGPAASQSYPGLLTHHEMYVYEVFLPQHLYKAEGYVEVQEDKTTYFVWVQA